MRAATSRDRRIRKQESRSAKVMVTLSGSLWHGSFSNNCRLLMKAAGCWTCLANPSRLSKRDTIREKTKVLFRASLRKGAVISHVTDHLLFLLALTPRRAPGGSLQYSRRRSVMTRSINDSFRTLSLSSEKQAHRSSKTRLAGIDKIVAPCGPQSDL